MDIHILGCSGGIGRGLHTTALRVGEDTLIDCGTGVGTLPLEDLLKIRHVFITHSHLDHIAGLPLLLDTIYDQLIQQPLTIHCQVETYDVLMKHVFNWTIWPNFFALPNKQTPVVKFEAMSPGKSITIGENTHTMVDVEHTVPAVGYLVQNSKTGFAFSGDTAHAPKLWEAVNTADNIEMLIVECAFANNRADIATQAKHFSPKSLSLALEELSVDLQICVSHLQPGKEEQIMSELREAMPHRSIRSISNGEVLSI
jgi:ribonuclease BN (tRNA processing enzyme)